MMEEKEEEKERKEQNRDDQPDEDKNVENESESENDHAARKEDKRGRTRKPQGRHPLNRASSRERGEPWMRGERVGDGGEPPHEREQAREKRNRGRNEKCKTRTGGNGYVRRAEEHRKED